MSQYNFSAVERLIVYTIHGEKCYICKKPLDLASMEVDHIIPEAMVKEPEKLSVTLEELGLPADFNINNYENWKPICKPCNLTKLELIFKPSLLFQTHLQQASEKKAKAIELEQNYVNNQKISRAITILVSAFENDKLTDQQKDILLPLLQILETDREPELRGTPLQLSPLISLISDDGMIKTIRGPYGVGGRPSNLHVHSSFNCPNCGSLAAWNGARCVVCGYLIDD